MIYKYSLNLIYYIKSFNFNFKKNHLRLILKNKIKNYLKLKKIFLLIS